MDPDNDYSEDGPTLSFEALEKIREMTNHDPDHFQRLVHEFINTADQLVGEMVTAQEAQQLEDYWKAAHSLRPMCAMFGAVALTRLSDRAEILGRSNAIRQLPPVTDRIQAAFAEVRSILQNDVL